MTKIEEITRLAHRLYTAGIDMKSLAYVVSEEEWCQLCNEMVPRDISYLTELRVRGLRIVRSDGVQILNGEL